MATEGEILINLWENGSQITDTTYWVELEALGETSLRLHNSTLSMRLDPTQSYGFEWFDPATDEVGVGGCGGLDDYNAGSTSTRGDEAHGGSGKEMHCIRPGQYRLNVWYGMPGDGTLKKSITVDYQQLEQRNNAAVIVMNGTTQENLAGVTYNPTGGRESVVDLVVDIDLGTGTGDSPVLKIDKPGVDPTTTSFNPVTSPAGTDNDYFRFSLVGSKTNWIPDTLTFLAKYFWDHGGPRAVSTGYRDPLSGNWVLNAFKHPGSVSGQTYVTVGVDLKRPDESEATAPQTTAQATITLTPRDPGNPSGPVACIGTDGITTWQNTDQYLRAAGCSTRGSNIRYRWHFGVGDTTAFTTDTLVDFRGHGPTGDYLVTLEARNISTGVSGFAQQHVGVQAGSTNITGDTYITDKNTHEYSSNRGGYWFERFDSLGTWYGTTDGSTDSTYTRIWPRGDYAVELRQQDASAGILRRGLLRVQMCYTNCEPPVERRMTAQGNPWHVFGAGPVISYGSSNGPLAQQFYSLVGKHAAGSPFASVSAALEGGGHLALHGSAQLSWVQVPTAAPTVKLTRYTLEAPVDETVFGIAYDFDLGDAGDDNSGFDSKRGMTFAFDKTQAVGVLIRRDGGNAVKSASQFGARRFAPSTASAVWNLQRDVGTDLLTGADDVQFIISAAPVKETAVYEVYLIHAESITTLQALADQIIAGAI